MSDKIESEKKIVWLLIDPTTGYPWEEEPYFIDREEAQRYADEVDWSKSAENIDRDLTKFPKEITPVVMAKYGIIDEDDFFIEGD